MAFDEIERAAKRAKPTISCPMDAVADDSVSDGREQTETGIEETKDQFLRTVEILIKPSARKRHVIGGEKKKELGWRKYIVDETKWPGNVTCCRKTFSRGGAFRYHVETHHVKSRRFRLG